MAKINRNIWSLQMLTLIKQNFATLPAFSNRWTRAHSRLVPSQWETLLQSNAVSHWLGANRESALWTLATHPKPTASVLLQNHLPLIDDQTQFLTISESPFQSTIIHWPLCIWDIFMSDNYIHIIHSVYQTSYVFINHSDHKGTSGQRWPK